MAYDYTLPDGSRIRVPDGTSLSTAESWARRDFPELYKATEAPTKQQEGFFANVKAGAKDLMANNALGIGAFGDEKAARDMRRAAAEEAKNVKTTTWEDVKAAGGIGNTLSTAGAFARDSLAGTLPYMAQTAAGAKIGALAGAATPLPGGALVGGALGAVGANLPALFGSNLARQDQENPNAPLNKTAAAAAAVPQAALDAASTVFLFGRALGVNKLAGEAINKLVTKSAAEVEAKLVASAQQSLLKASAKGAASGAVVEMPTELAQTVLERWQAGLTLTGPEANKEYEATLAGAAAVGGALGPVHSIQARNAAQATIKEREQVTADAARADALLKDEAEKQKQAEYRKTPEYLLDLDARRQAAETHVKGLRDQINSLKDFKEGTAEFEQRKALGQQVKDAVKEAKSIFAEYNPRKAEIAVLKEREGMTPDEYFEFKNYGIKPPPKEDPGAKSELGPDEADAARNYVNGLPDKPIADVDVNDYVEHILADPAQAAAALNAKVRVPGATPKQNNAIWGLVKLRLAEQAEQAKKAAEEAKAADARAEVEAEAKRARFATQPTDATDPTEAWKQSLEQDNDVAGDLTRTGEYAYNGDAPSQQRLPGTPPPLEPGKVEAFALGEYKPGTEITDPKTAHAHQAYTELRAKYERAMAEYERVAGTGSPQAIEARKTLAALSRAMDEAARQLDPSVGASTAATPKEISDSGIDDLLNRALEPAAGNGPPTLPVDLEQSVQRLAETRRGLFQKFTAALASKFSLQQALGNIEDRKAVNVRGQLVPTEDRWEAKRDKLAEADSAQKQARSELIAASIEEIKKQRELAGKLPLAHSDADLAKIISKRLDTAYANTSNLVPKGGPKTATGTVDKGTETKIKARMAYVQARISELEETIYEKQGPLTRQESDNIYAELRQLDDEQARLHGSLREINREFDKVSKERQVALDRQLATVNARIRNMRTSADKGDRRITGGASAFVDSERRSELGRLEAARRNILERQSMGTSEAMMHEALQNIITNLTVNRNLPTRANAVKEGLRKGATGQVNKLRELVLGGRQFPGREVETGSTEFGEAYGLKSGEEQFKASKDDAALVQRMREEELAELNDAAKDPRYDAKTQERIDNAIAALHGKLNDPITEADVARAKERYKPETGESGDLFSENLPKDIDRAGSEYDAARDAADTGKKEFGQALGGMKNKSPLLDIANKLASKFGKTASGAAVSTYKEAKARLDAIRAKLPALKKSQEDARSEVHAAVDAKVANDAMEADAQLKATQRTAAAVLQQMKQRRDAATGPAKVELSENMQMLTALIRELREELRPQLASIRNEHGLSEQDIQDFYVKLMPKKPSGEALRNATERDTAATMHEVDKEMTSAALIDALEQDDAASIREIERLLGKIDSMGEDGAASTGAALRAVQAKYDDLVEKIRLERDWAAKIKKDRAPTAKKIAAVEDAVSSIKQAVSEIAPNADAPMSAIAKMVVAARETYKQWQDALNKAMETIDALERHGVPDKEAKTDARSTHFIKLAGKLQDDYYKQMQAIAEANTAKNPAALKAEEAAEKRYEESVERAGELQKRLEALYKPESRVDAKGLWPADKFGPAVEPPTPQVVRGTYGTAYAKDKSNQTEDARKAAADARTQRLAEGKAAEDKPAIEFNGQKEMTILVPEETSADVRFKLVEWLRAKGHVAAAEEIENDAAEVVIDNWIKDRTWAKENTKALKASIAARDKRSTVVVREALSEADIAKAQKAATAQFAAAVRMGERQTAIRPQRSKASSTLKTGAKRGRKPAAEELDTRLGNGEMSVGDVNAPDVESRVDKAVLFSRGKPAKPSSTMDVAKEAIHALGENILARFNSDKKPVLYIYGTAQEAQQEYPDLNIPDDAKGFAFNSRAFLIAENIGNGETLGVLLHEIGVHVGFRNFFTKPQFESLVRAVQGWAAKRDGSIEARIGRAALLRAKEAETKPEDMSDEILAYAVEEAVKAGVEPAGMKGGTPVARWLRVLFDRFEKAVKDFFGVKDAELNAHDLVSFAYGAAQLELKGTWHGSPNHFAEPLAFDHSHMGEGEGGQYYGWGTYRAQRRGVATTYMFPDKALKKFFASDEGQKWLKNNSLTYGGHSAEDFYAFASSKANTPQKLAGISKTNAMGMAQALLQASRKPESFTSVGEAVKKAFPKRAIYASAAGAPITYRPGQIHDEFDATKVRGPHEKIMYKGDFVHSVSTESKDVIASIYYSTTIPHQREALDALSGPSLKKAIQENIAHVIAEEAEYVSFVRKNGVSKEDADYLKDALANIEALKRIDPDDFSNNKPTPRPAHAEGSMYRAIHEQQDHEFLDWFATAEQQSPHVLKNFQAAFESLTEAQRKEFNRILGDPVGATGRDMYAALSHALRGNEKAASELLHKFGVVGNKFFDFDSRQPRETAPTYNYVDYSDKNSRIVKYDEGRVGPAKGVLFSRAKTAYANSDLEDAVGVMVGGRKDKLAEIRAHATGLEFRTRFIDAYAGIKEALKAGDPTKAVQVTYDLMNFAQRNHFVQQAVMVGTPTRAWWGKLHGKDTYKTEVQEGASLKNVSDMLGKVKGFGNSQATSDAFTLYALAKRAQTDGWDRVFADLSVPLKAGPAQVAEIEKENARRQKARAYADTLAKAENDPFKLAYAEYQAWNKGMLQFAQQAGIISEEEFRRLASKQNYTPLFRADKFGNMVLEIDQGRDITVGRLADEPHMQKMLGGSGQVMDFFTASVRNASVIIDASLHNIASREAAMSLYAMGAAHPVSATEKGDNIVEFRGPDEDGKVDLQRFAVDTAGTAAGHIPTDLLVKGFAGVPASLPGFVRMMGVPAQLLRKTVTRAPPYMFRTIIRDPMSAYLTTGANFNPITDTLSELSKALRGKADPTLDRRGITGGALFAENELDLDRIRDEAKNNGNWWNIGYYMAAFDHAVHAIDAITRRNVYNGALKEGASEIEASIASYESMPFSKRGTSSSVRNLNHMIPFLSAMIQGWDVMYRAAKGDMPLHERVNVRNKLLARGTMIFGLTMMYAMANADDEAYQNANTSERLNNWLVRIPGMDNPLKVPIPFELGVIFKMIPEAIVRVFMSDKDMGKEFRDVGAALANMAPNLLMPQAMLPVTEAMLNRSFFTGRDIEGRALQNVDIGQRYDKNTSELSKALGFDFDLFGTQVGVSPKMLEYMAGQYTGGLYGALAAVVDNVLPAGDKEKPDRTLAQMPLFKTVLLQEDAGGKVNRLYDSIEKFTRTEATFKKMIAEGDAEGAKRYAEDNREEFGKAKVASAAKAVLDKFSTMEKTIRASDWDGAKKKAALDNIQRIKSSLAEKYDAVR